MYPSIKISILKVALFLVLPFLKCKQGNDFIAEETTDLLLRERGKLERGHLCAYPNATLPQSRLYKPYRDSSQVSSIHSPFLHQAHEWRACQV